jgi:hypothetical protein
MPHAGEWLVWRDDHSPTSLNQGWSMDSLEDFYNTNDLKVMQEAIDQLVASYKDPSLLF